MVRGGTCRSLTVHWTGCVCIITLTRILKYCAECNYVNDRKILLMYKSGG